MSQMQLSQAAKKPTPYGEGVGCQKYSVLQWKSTSRKTLRGLAGLIEKPCRLQVHKPGLPFNRFTAGARGALLHYNFVAGVRIHWGSPKIGNTHGLTPPCLPDRKT
jgi:hypothetical protein